MQRDLKALLDGAVCGGAATVAMSVVTTAAQQLGALPHHPAKDISEAALEAAGVQPEHDGLEVSALSVLTHFGFGSGVGALFAVLHRRLKLPIPAVLHGVIFGTLVWAVSYKGWIPALGILPPPDKDRPGRVGAMLLAHWVYGAVLGALVARSEPPQSEN